MLRYLVVSSIVTVLTSSFGEDGMDLVETPHGYRPSKCIIRHNEPYVELNDTADGVWAYYPQSGMAKFFERDPDCMANWAQLELDAWDVDAGYTTPGIMGNFTSLYGIPNESPPKDGQLLYYFIGFQNNDGSGGGVTIVQPVVNYDSSGQYPAGWSMEPWNCCPSGQSHSGTVITLSAGAQGIQAWVYAQGAGNDVVIGMSYNNKPSVLTVKNNNRNMDWACVTLEEYSVSSCNDYNKQPFKFTKMVLTDLKGNTVDPKWKINNGQKSCNGGVVTNDDYNLDIYGADKP